MAALCHTYQHTTEFLLIIYRLCPTKTQHLALPFVKFCRSAALKYIFLRWCHAHMLSQKVTKHMNFGSSGKNKYFCIKIAR